MNKFELVHVLGSFPSAHVHVESKCSPYFYWQAGNWPSTDRSSC